MKSEYVKLSSDEKFFGTKNLLQSQESMINLLKHFDKYGELRKDEMNLRVSLKSKIGEAMNIVDNLIRSLPKARMEDNEPDEFEILDREKREKKETHERELEDIRQKLASLG
ncbi:hypothetical protein J4217_00845 [Candidatus Pacearchaeota archaeon]|nr:hypothetical protein [Candidatus Pacearchaeota archaeon]